MIIRKATKSDLEQIVNLLRDDDLGSTREDSLGESKASYQSAFQSILTSEYFDFFVMEESETLIGCYQIMYLPHVSFKGTKRAQVESVRIQKTHRGKGLGAKLMEHAIDQAKKMGCGIFQLTSNKDRIEAGQFYRRLGMEPTHNGYKRYL